MDKKTAQELIEKTFNNAFSEEQFTVFAKNLLNDFEDKHNQYSGNLIWDDYKEHISTYKRIGKYIDPDGEALDVLIVEVKSVTKLERARTALRNFVIKHLSKFDKDYALVAFYSKQDEGADWRFSFIKLEYKSELDEEKGKVKLKKEFTPAKRYSFLVGKYEKSHTAKNQLLPLLQNIANNPVIAQQKNDDGSLESAFSIDKVTDEFFNQYKDLYIKLFELFENDSHVKAAIEQAGIDNTRFTKKLLGQIVFLYFLQKKGWLGVPKNERWGTGKKRFVQELFEQAKSEGVNFFKDKLQYLFYDALAKERDNANSFYELFQCRIPFLNGGLFEADYKWETANITIPEYIFRNKDKNKSGDEGTGVLDVFDRYNFTIKEDEPLDKEVAVDPEMLGKVFENMLDIKERKSKGAFYTPREIVHYMCQESLIHYLDNALEGKVKKEEIEEFVRKGHSYLENDINALSKLEKIKAGEQKSTDAELKLPESIRKNADLIDQKLSSIKICDPAIGSGAFPVGLLHELVNTMLVLKPHLSYDYLTKKLKGFGFTHRESISDSRYIYRLKRHIIQESIYGVDIDSSAIDIARLRLWLSLVVDEDDLDPIETLPNLDYKIVCGNSLIGFPDGWQSPAFDRIEKLKDEFYNVTDYDRKKDLKQEIEGEINNRLATSKRVFGYQVDFDFKLFFSEVWREKGGFDVVIGNPPYGADLTAEEKKFFKNEFSDVHMRTPDTFNYFISKGFRLLHNDGVITYIVPNNLFFQSEYEKTRKFLLAKNQFYIGINLGDGVFNTATVPSCIFLTSKINSGLNKYRYADLRNANKKNLDFREIFKLESISSTLKTPASVFGISEEEFRIIEKLRKVSVTIDDIAEEMASGISTGGDKIFRIPKDFAVQNNFEKEILKPVLVGGEIDKYKIENTNHVLIYSYKKSSTDRLENIFSYLKPFEAKLSQKRETRQGKLPWWCLHWHRYPELFEGEKIIMRQTSDRIRAVFDKDEFYVLNSILVFKKRNDSELSYKFILASLNSSVNEFLYSKFTQEEGRTFAEVKPKNVRKLFVPNSNCNSQSVTSLIVDYLLKWNKHKEKNTVESKFFESVLDTIVFELFLNEEIKSAGKEILKHLGELKPITDDMSEEKKLAIIQSEFERLYDPNHPVRFAIETLDSVEEVRIIKEALK